MVAFARRLCHGGEDAEGIVHEAFIRTVRHPELDESRIDRFLHTVIRRLVADQHRSRQREQRIVAESRVRPEPQPSHEERVAERAEASHWTRLLDRFSERDRRIIHARAARKSNSEIAEELAMTVEAVESVLARVRRHLRAAVTSNE